jgi:hypothetical protein
MDIPENVDAWTYDTVLNVVRRHEFEPGRFDYKEVLNAAGQGKGEHTASIRHTVCSMANAFGGYILFGVADRQKQIVPPERRIVGIPFAPDLRKEFGDKLAQIEREVYFNANAIRLPDDDTQCVFVAQVPTSNLRPHVDKSDGRFLIRGEGGSANPMGFIQVRDQMLYTEGRLQKVTLLRFELATFQKVFMMLGDPSTGSVRFDVSAFKLLLADVCDMLQSDSGLLAVLHDIATHASASLGVIAPFGVSLRKSLTRCPVRRNVAVLGLSVGASCHPSCSSSSCLS